MTTIIYDGASTTSGSTHEVFLSCSGEDIDLNFTNHLYSYLTDVGVETFMDNELHVGEEIGPRLMKAIEASSISIPIFSKGYASSKWCLREVTHMVKCMNDKDPEGRQRHTVYPIFYDVTPFQVWSQTGSFAEAFLKHTKEVDESTVQEWKDALKTVSRLKGMNNSSRHDAELLKRIVIDVCQMLKENDAAQMTTKGEPLESSIQADAAEDESSDWVNEELKKLKKEEKPAISRIRKVPQLLFDSEYYKHSKYFKPKVLFLGPFHRELEHEESKQFKLKAASLFMDATSNFDVGEWKKPYKKIRKNVNQFMELYALQTKESQDSREENFNAWMFFLDGCAAMYFICGANDAAQCGIKTHELVFAQQDLLMLENQLPFDVLKWLMEWKFRKLPYKNWYMERFIERHIPTQSMGNVVKKDCDPIHLLHLMRTRLQEATSSYKNLNSDTAAVDTSLLYSCRSAVQLHKRGISFRASPSRRKKQVDFDDRSLSGVLYLPSIMIDDFSKGKLLNLVADEMSSDVRNTSEIASYLCFLDSLIDDAADVKILRESNIIRNVLGSDQELAKLFNEITENVVPDTEIYKGVMAAIQSHFDNKTKTWMAQLYDDYFRTPWALIAFSAAILLLSLSLTQTYLTLVPPASEERSQWKRLWNIVKHIYMPIVLALPMMVLLLIISLVSLVVIYMYGFPSKYKKQGQIKRGGKHEPDPLAEFYIQVAGTRSPSGEWEE